MRIHFQPRHAAVPLLVVGALALPVAGCGSDDKTLSKAEVIKQGSAICEAQEARVEALPQLTSENPFDEDAPKEDRETARNFLAGYADALQTVRSELGALRLPAQDKEQLEGFINDLGPTVEQLRAAERAAADNDPAAVPMAAKAFGLFEEASKKTAAYGFPEDVCGA
jgi:hypothetical protein